VKNTHRVISYQRAESLVNKEWQEVTGLYGKSVALVSLGGAMKNGGYNYAIVYDGASSYRLFEVKLEKL